MASKGINASLRNAMHRHPQMVKKSVYFAGQDENSSNTYLRWLGSFWDSMHNGSEAMAGMESWKRKYLPVGLANGAAGNHPGYGCKWNHFGGSAEYVNFYDWEDGDIIPYSTTNEYAFGGISGEHPYNTERTPDSLIDYKKYDMPSEAGITYSNAGYNNQWTRSGRTCRFKWPFGEYRPVFADARPWATDVNGIPVQLEHLGIYYDDGVATHSGPWRIRDLGSQSFYNLPVHYEAGEWISIVDSQSPLTSSLNGDPYKLDHDDIITDWSEENRDNGTHPIEMCQTTYNPVAFKEDGDIRFRTGPNAYQLDNENENTGITGYSDEEVFCKTYAAMFGMNPNYLSQQKLEITVFDESNNMLFRCHTHFDKLWKYSYYLEVKHADWTVSYPIMSGFLPNTATEWWGAGGNEYFWGENPKIQVQIINESGEAWTHFPPNDNLLDWKQESSHDVDQYDNYCRVERDEDHIQLGLDYKPEIRTPTRSVLLYDLAGAIPAGAPIMSAELFLTSMGRWNWPNEEVSPDWTTDTNVLEGHTGPRRLKVGKGAQYQISQLHPSTTKEATWGTYNGTNPWTDLTDGQIHGETCSILPNVFNMGGGESSSSYKYFGMGWKFDQNINGYPWHNHPERQIADTNSLREWMSFQYYEDYEPPEDYWTHTAVRGPSEEEHRGITGGGVMVVSPELPGDNSSISGFSQNEIYELTGRRARDVIDFNMTSNDAGATVAGGGGIDVTAFARDAIYNMDGKLRLAITGKTITGDTQDPGDIYKSESSWSHYAYQYNNDYPYGGGKREWDFGLQEWVDTPGPDAQHPYCGPHTIKTEFYSLSDDSVKETLSSIIFSNAVEGSSPGQLDGVIEWTEFLAAWRDVLINVPEIGDATKARDSFTCFYNMFNVNLDYFGKVWGEFRITWPLTLGPLVDNPYIITLEEEMQKLKTQLNDNSGGLPEGTKIKLTVEPISDNAAQNPTIITIGQDATGNNSYDIGYMTDQSVSVGKVDYNDKVVEIWMSFYFKHPEEATDPTPAGTKVMLRNYLDGENHHDVFNTQFSRVSGYFTGDLGVYESGEPPILGEDMVYATDMKMEYSTGAVPDDDGSNYMSNFENGFPVSQVGDIFGITYDIPAGATHDNRGTYSVKSIIDEYGIIEVNEDVTTQSISSGADYGTITATNFMNRPYLKLTYSEQEAYGV